MTCRRVAVAALAAMAAASPARADESGQAAASIWDGVFTSAQAGRGERLYAEPCGRCHGFRLDGAPDDPDMFSTPPIGGAKFLRDWEGASLGVLFEYTRATMPANNPGYLSDQEFADVVAYMLSVSGVPAGPGELLPDARGLAAILIAPGP